MAAFFAAAKPSPGLRLRGGEKGDPDPGVSPRPDRPSAGDRFAGAIWKKMRQIRRLPGQ
jgi:hypothetical protein